MKVLGVDPGYDRLGVAILEKENGTEVLRYSSCITSNKEDALSKRTHDAVETFVSLLREHKPEAVAIERLFFNKNQKTVMAVSEIRGALIYAAEKEGCRVYEYTPQEIKVAVTGYGKSTKDQVASMVSRLVRGVPKDALDDEYDAIAAALTCLATIHTNQ